jgi:GNAT superfamily N-acetyltransferase
VVRDGPAIVGALHVRIAASLAHIEALYVLAAYRGRGSGRRLVTRAEELANYYNCHKVCVAVFAEHPAHGFFERSGYKLEAVLPQHTFKLDVALMRKFLL